MQFTARTPTQINPYPFWTFWVDLDQAAYYSQQCTGNLPTQTSTFIGRAGIVFLLSIVFSTPLHIEHGLFLQAHIYFKKKSSTCWGYYKGDSIPL